MIVEVLSDSTAKTDQGLKKEIYQEIFRTPEYFWFDPDSLEPRGFALVQGQYQDMQPNQEGRPWSEQLQLFSGVQDIHLRFFTPAGELLLSPTESAQHEQQQRQVAEDLLAQYRARLGELPSD